MKAFVPAPILPLLSLLPGTAGVKQDLALLQRTVFHTMRGFNAQRRRPRGALRIARRLKRPSTACRKKLETKHKWGHWDEVAEDHPVQARLSASL